MITTSKQHQHLVPDPRWLPLIDGLIHHTSTTELNLATFELGGQSWKDLPRTIGPSARSRALRLVFNDGGAIDVQPWELFSKDGRHLDSAQAVTLNAVRRAWRAVVESFGSAVLKERYILFGRFDDFRAEFEQIPSDHWLLYNIMDWSTGRAIAPDGCEVWSIHVYCPTLENPRLGRKRSYDRDQVAGEIRRLFHKLGRYGPDKEPGWQTRADLEEQIAQFLLNTTGQTPAKSTLQGLVKEALRALEAEKPN
jgi:hypothetical protein